MSSMEAGKGSDMIAGDGSCNEAVAAVVDVLLKELSTVLEIAEMERCKWPLLAAARLVATL